MTTSHHPDDRPARPSATERARHDAAEIQAAVLAAADDLDPAAIIAGGRRLRSLLYRLESTGITAAKLKEEPVP